LEQRLMPEQTGVRKLLVLRGPSRTAAEVGQALSTLFEVHVVEGLDEALEAMRSGRFDAVLSETSDFLPLERGVVTQRASVVLDTLGDGVAVIGPGGELVWANRRLRDFSPELIQLLRQPCARTYEEFATRGGRGEARRRFALMPDGGEYYEVICSPVRDRQGLLRQVVAVVVNATTQRRQQRKLNAIDRAGRELVRLHDEVLAQRNAAQRLAVLEDRIIRCSRDVLDYQHFAVLLLNERTNRLEPVVAEGLDETAGGHTLFASTEDNGICGYVAATGRSYICADVRRDRRYKPGLAGARSSLTVPLRLHDKVVGVLNVESDRPQAFAEEDRQFAEIFARHVALALHILDLLIHERRSTHTQLSGSIAAELSGPINDLISDVSELREDYIGHDDLRRRLDGVIDLGGRAREAVQRLGRPGAVMPGPAGPAQADTVLAGKRVLVADDEEVIRQTVRDVLRPCGCEVDEAADGADAIAHLRRGRYDLVISDIKMPGADGYEVFAAAKQTCPQTGVILITAFGYDPHHAIVRAHQGGLEGVLFKPFKVRQLLDKCREALTQEG
jgi:CheY-like chemotaxis protein